MIFLFFCVFYFIIIQKCIPVGCVPLAAVAVCWGRGCLPQCMLGTPPGCDLDTPRPDPPTSPLGLGLDTSRGSRGGPRGPGPPPDPRFWGPKIEHFAALFNFSIIFFASLRSAYYFFNMLLFHSSNWKIFQPRFARHVISHLQVLVSHILGY